MGLRLCIKLAAIVAGFVTFYVLYILVTPFMIEVLQPPPAAQAIVWRGTIGVGIVVGFVIYKALMRTVARR